MEAVEVRVLTQADLHLVEAAGDDVFDNPAVPQLAAEFLADPRHHIVAAIEGGRIVGFGTAVDYVHPDKPRELWINEVGVSESHRGHGIAKRIMHELFEHGKRIGCVNAWVLTEEDNIPAQRLYAASGGEQQRVVYFTFSLDGQSEERPAE